MSDPDEQKKVGAPPRRIAPDEERTHLLILDPLCLEDESEKGKEAAPEEPPTRLAIDAMKPGAAGDARTGTAQFCP